MEIKYVSKVFVLIICTFVSFACSAQSFELMNGDTINRMDALQQKQGRWLVINKDFKNKTYPDNALMEELNYKDNKKEGVCKQYFSNGKLKREVTYKANRPSGYAKFYYEDGTIAEEGNWIYGGWDGKYKNYYEEGSVSSDLSYAYGKKDGDQKMYYPNGKLKLEGSWKNGIPDGVVKEYDDRGVLLSEEKYKNGIVDSTSSKYYAKTATSEENMSEVSDTVKVFTGEGYYKVKNKFGKLAKEGTFSSGKLMDGNQYYYSENGILKKTLIYKGGEVIQTIEEK